MRHKTRLFASMLQRYCVEEQIHLAQEKFIERLALLKQKRIMDNFPDEEILEI